MLMYLCIQSFNWTSPFECEYILSWKIRLCYINTLILTLLKTYLVYIHAHVIIL